VQDSSRQIGARVATPPERNKIGAKEAAKYEKLKYEKLPFKGHRLLRIFNTEAAIEENANLEYSIYYLRVMRMLPSLQQVPYF
jgi:hypothetical protein